MGEVRHDAFFGATIIEGKQVVDDTVIERAMRDPAIEAIFSNSEIGDYIEQLIMLCRSRDLEIQDLQKEIIGKDEEISKYRQRAYEYRLFITRAKHLLDGYPC